MNHVSQSLATTPNCSKRVKFLAFENVIIKWGRVTRKVTMMGGVKVIRIQIANANAIKREQPMDITNLTCIIRENRMIER